MKALDSHYKRFLNNQKKKRDDDTTLSSKIHRFSVVTIQRDTKSDPNNDFQLSVKTRSS